MKPIDPIPRLLLSGVFLYAGVVKWIDPTAFYEAILTYRIVDGRFALAATYWISSLEVVLAVALWVPRYRLVAVVVSFVLLLVFSALIALAWVRGIDLSCGCFGVAGEGATAHWELLGRDIVLLLVAARVWHASRRREVDS